MMWWHFFTSWLKNKYWQFQGYEVLAPKRIMMHRMAECDACPHNQEGTCGICKCLIMSKVMLSSESCPRKFWPSVRVRKIDYTLR